MFSKYCINLKEIIEKVDIWMEDFNVIRCKLRNVDIITVYTVEYIETVEVLFAIKSGKLVL